MKNFAKLGILFLCVYTTAIYSQLSITQGGVNYTIDFDNSVSGVNNGQFAGTGFTPTPSTGQLNSEAWAVTGLSDGSLSFGGTASTGDFARGSSTGGVTTGGIYAFEVLSGNRALGIQPSTDDYTTGTIVLRLQNNTIGSITSLLLSYNIYVFNDQDRSNSFNLSFSYDNINYFPFSSLDFNSPDVKSSSPTWNAIPRSETLSGFNVGQGKYLFLRWRGDDVIGSGERDEFSLDDIVVNATVTTTTIVHLGSTSFLSNENDGTFNINVSIQNPATSTTQIDLALLNSAIYSADVNNFNSQTIIFPANSSEDISIPITITDDVLSEGIENLTFVLQNINGGNIASIGVPNTFTLTIYDNEIVNLIINEILVDPDQTTGDANGDGTVSVTQDEFIELINNEAFQINLSGWTISDNFAIRHTFPNGTLIDPVKSITIFGGGSPNNIPGIFQTASTGTLGLNNTGDILTIRNSSNVIVESYSYGTEGNNNQSLARNPDITGTFVQHTSILTNPVNYSPGRYNSDNAPLPVELTSFSASVVGNAVKLNWRTETEVNNYGFEVERIVGSLQSTVGNWEKIGFVNGNGNSNSPKSYSFDDKNVTAGKYSYRLKQIDNDGQFEYSKAIEVNFGAPKKFELSQNYPNPFNPITTISFNLPEADNVKLTVFNILGQELKTLVNEFKESGVHTINFDASELNSGMYIYKIEAGTFVQTRKMTLVK